MIEICSCNFTNSQHRQALVDLMNAYLADDMGGNMAPLTDAKTRLLVEGLEKHPSKLILTN